MQSLPIDHYQRKEMQQMPTRPLPFIEQPRVTFQTWKDTELLKKDLLNAKKLAQLLTSSSDRIIYRDTESIEYEGFQADLDQSTVVLAKGQEALLRFIQSATSLFEAAKIPFFSTDNYCTHGKEGLLELSKLICTVYGEYNE
jgi:hypothetical protein